MTGHNDTVISPAQATLGTWVVSKPQIAAADESQDKKIGPTLHTPLPLTPPGPSGACRTGQTGSGEAECGSVMYW